MIGYCLFAKDNGIYFFENVPKGVLCDKCGTCLNLDYYPKNLNISSKRRYDVSFTYDGRLIVSSKFKKHCIKNKIEGINFYNINKKIDHYYLLPEKQIEFNSEKRKTRFINACSVCGGFESVIGSTPAFLKNINDPIRFGIFRTDLMFGSNKEKFPLIIIGIDTYLLMSKEKFTGAEYEPIN